MGAYIGYLSSNGMITIPKKLRDMLGIEQDTPLLFEVEENELVVKKANVVDDDVLQRLWRKYGVDRRPYKEVIKELRAVRREVYKEEYG